MNRVKTSALIAAYTWLTSPGCSDVELESGDTGGMTATVGTTEATGAGTSGGDDCTPGYESCECVGGELCLAGLSCVSKVCVDLGSLTTSGAEGSGEETGKDTVPDEPPEGEGCLVSADCAENEVCAAEGFCGDTDLFYFDVRVHTFGPDDCSDGFGTAEIYFSYSMNGVLQASSPTSTCPGSWSDYEMPLYDSLQSLSLSFWELDAFEDDQYAELCWQDIYGACTVVPKNILHAGYYGDYVGYNQEFYLEVSFTVAPSSWGE